MLDTPLLRGLLSAPETVTADLPWEPFRPGVDAYWFYRSADGGPAAALLRYAPGAAVPRHLHAGWEHILVLTGEQSDGSVDLVAGDMSVSRPRTTHAVSSRQGCLALLIWEKAPVMELADD